MHTKYFYAVCCLPFRNLSSASAQVPCIHLCWIVNDCYRSSKKAPIKHTLLLISFTLVWSLYNVRFYFWFREGVLFCCRTFRATLISEHSLCRWACLRAWALPLPSLAERAALAHVLTLEKVRAPPEPGVLDITGLRVTAAIFVCVCTPSQLPGFDSCQLDGQNQYEMSLNLLVWRGICVWNGNCCIYLPSWLGRSSFRNYNSTLFIPQTNAGLLCF